MIYIDTERCTGCGACLEVCPTGALRLVEGKATIAPEICRGCEACLEACPEKAILAVHEPAPATQTAPAKAARITPSLAPATKALPWLGAALAFVGRELVPRVAAALLDAAQRRVETRPSVPSLNRMVSPAQTKGGHRYGFRWRHGR